MNVLFWKLLLLPFALVFVFFGLIVYYSNKIFKWEFLGGGE